MPVAGHFEVTVVLLLDFPDMLQERVDFAPVQIMGDRMTKDGFVGVQCAPLSEGMEFIFFKD